MRGRIAGLILAVAGWAPIAAGHGGGLDKHGCHNDRRNGGYHCHRGGGAAAPARRSAGDGAASFVPGREAARPGGSYRNCTEARAAGAAPLNRGEPGYGAHLDRDGDGIACEPYRGR